MPYPAPKLKKIDPEMVLFGTIRIEWEDVGAPVYYLYRDYEVIDNVAGWQPYRIIEDGKTYFEDSMFENGRTYYYAVRAASKDGHDLSPLSNSESITVKIPPNLIVDEHQVAEAAYYESQKPRKIDDKIWELARLKLIVEKTFPSYDLDYLKTKIKSLRRDLPDFKGLFYQPTEQEIRTKAEELYALNMNPMEIDWQLSELRLIIRKIEDLIEFEKEIR